MIVNDNTLLCTGVVTSAFYETWIDQNWIGTNQKPPGTHQETTRTMQESTRERLFIPAHDFLLICLHQPQYCFCLHYRNQGGLHLAYMRSMSSLENPMVISYYFHYPVQAQAHGIKFEGETDIRLPKKFSVLKIELHAFCAHDPYVPTWLRVFVPQITTCKRA